MPVPPDSPDPSAPPLADTPAAWVDRAAAPCFHLALLLRRTPPDGHAAADAALAAAVTALARLHPCDESRALGLRPDHLQAVRHALAALLDESAGERWRDRLFHHLDLPHSDNIGHEFFERLEPRLADPNPSPADLAVLQVHALCLHLGLRGRYGARVDATEAELHHLLRRLQLKLRPCLAARPPPPFGHVPKTMPGRPPHHSLRLAALLAVFALAFAAGARTHHTGHARDLRAHLSTLAPPP